MNITVMQERGRNPVTVFRIEGGINLGNAHELEQKAQEAYQEGTRNLLMDLSDVSSLTSAGLRAIMVIDRLLGGGASWPRTPDAVSGEERLGGQPTGGSASSEPETTTGTHKSPHLKLLSPQPYVLRVLRVAGVEDSIEIHDNLKDAIASF